VEASIHLSKMSNFDDTDMYSTLTWSATDSSESIVDFNEEEETKPEKKSFGESFKDKLGLGKSETKLKRNLPHREENTESERQKILTTEKVVGV
jgi:hypothetical protein